jgi:hypothetical protein
VAIPGASDAERKARYDAYEHDEDVIQAYEHERTAIEGVWEVYLATVKRRSADQKTPGAFSLTVQPVWQVRGLLPKETRTVQEGPLSSCAYRWRQLRGTKVGDLIIVFENPGSIVGMKADDARTGELVDAITQYALSVSPQRR